MGLLLNENIRNYRKQMHMTQEQLAEAMSVSVATISKWEQGRISPDVEMLVELADFFHISVDALLGYQWRTRSMGECAMYIRELRNEGKYAEGISEAHKALQKYPNIFSVVYECGKLLFGSLMNRARGQQEVKTEELEFLLNVYNHALELYEQNTDKNIGRESIYQDIANIYALKGEMKKAIEYLENHNEYHINDYRIGAFLGQTGEYDRAWEYISRTFRRSLIELCMNYEGCVYLLINTGKYDDVIEMSDWIYHLCENASDKESSYFWLIAAKADAIKATAYAYKAVLQSEDYQSEMEQCLENALQKANKFDENPDYNGKIKWIPCIESASHNDYEKSAVTVVKNVLKYAREDGQPYQYLITCYDNLLRRDKERKEKKSEEPNF